MTEPQDDTSAEQVSPQIPHLRPADGRAGPESLVQPPAAQEAAPQSGTSSSTSAPKKMNKTPLFAATHALRYQRQALIKAIDDETKTKLLCFVVGEGREIERDDTLGFVDLLANIYPNTPVDLMIHTIGGDVDAAQKLIEMVYARIVKKEGFRVIVPEHAKSAGTLMALGASEIIMSDSSELGMIDPQYHLKDIHGNEICISVVAYLQAYEAHSRAVNENPNDRAAAAMLAHFDPIVVRKFQSQRDRANDVAMRMLNWQGVNASAITASLLSLSEWKSHGQMISHADATQIGLKVKYLSPDSDLWHKYWNLHCLQRLEVRKDKKLYESAWVSQIFEE